MRDMDAVRFGLAAFLSSPQMPGTSTV